MQKEIFFLKTLCIKNGVLAHVGLRTHKRVYPKACAMRNNMQYTVIQYVAAN
jgi:hypothetical protein